MQKGSRGRRDGSTLGEREKVPLNAVGGWKGEKDGNSRFEHNKVRQDQKSTNSVKGGMERLSLMLPRKKIQIGFMRDGQGKGGGTGFKKKVGVGDILGVAWGWREGYSHARH